MTNNYWIKLYHEILNDPKMGMLPDNVWRRCIELFLLAGELDNDGALPTAEEIAWRLRQPDLEKFRGELEHLERAGILTKTESGWTVTKFADRQAPISTADRMKAYRERKRQQPSSNGHNPPPTRDEPEAVTDEVEKSDELVTRTVTKRNADIDTDKESTTTTTAPAHEGDWFEELTETFPDNRTDDFRIENGTDQPPDIDPVLGKIKTTCELHGLWLNPTLSAKIDDIYDEITPPDSETKLEWFEYAISEAATTDSRPKWALIETIVRGVQASGSLVIHKANRAEQKQNGGKNNGNSTDDSGGNSGGKRQAKKPAGIRSPGWKYEADRSYLDEYIASPAIGD